MSRQSAWLLAPKIGRAASRVLQGGEDVTRVEILDLSTWA